MDNSNAFKLGFVCAVAGFLLACLLKTCERPIEFRGSHTVVTNVDTVYQDTGRAHFFPKIIPGAPVIKWLSPSKDSTLCDYIRVYADSSRDSSIVIYLEDSVQGALLGTKLSYRLLGIKQVNTTTIITDTIPFKVKTPAHHVYLSGEVGGNKTMFNASVGIDWLTKKKLGIGYRYGVMDRTHNISLKVKVF